MSFWEMLAAATMTGGSSPAPEIWLSMMELSTLRAEGLLKRMLSLDGQSAL